MEERNFSLDFLKIVAKNGIIFHQKLIPLRT